MDFYILVYRSGLKHLEKIISFFRKKIVYLQVA